MSELEWLKLVLPFILGGFIFMIKRELSAKEGDIREMKVQIQDLKDSRVHKDELREFKVELRSMFEDLRQDIRALRNEKT